MAWIGVMALAWGSLAGAPWGTCRPAAAQETFEELRERVRAKSVEDTEDLLDHQRQLAKLDPAEQERLRSLASQLEQDPNGKRLRQVMHGYYDWLRTLPPIEREELMGLSPPERIAKIKAMLKTEEARKKASKGPGAREVASADRFRRALLYGGRNASFFSPDDMEGMLQWLDHYVTERKSELVGQIAPSQREELKNQLAQATNPQDQDPLRKHEVAAILMLRWQLDHPGETPPLTDDEMKELREGLSERTRTRLELRPKSEQWRVVSGLIGLFVLSQWGPRGTGAHLQAVRDEELAQFFEEGLSRKDQAWLLSLSGERISQELLRMYIHRKLYQWPGAPPDLPDVGPREKRPGPLGPPFRPGFPSPGFSPPGPKPPAKPDAAGKTGGKGRAGAEAKAKPATKPAGKTAPP
jgi:hypothetical protein